MGIGALWKTSRRLVILVGAAAVIQLMSLWLFRPFQLHQPLLLARYQLMIVPFYLIAIAVGAAALIQSQREKSLAVRLTTQAILLALGLGYLASSPLFGAGYQESRLQNHNAYTRFTQPLPEYPAEQVSEFYRGLGTEYPSGAILELPWQPTWN